MTMLKIRCCCQEAIFKGGKQKDEVCQILQIYKNWIKSQWQQFYGVMNLILNIFKLSVCIGDQEGGKAVGVYSRL